MTSSKGEEPKAREQGLYHVRRQPNGEWIVMDWYNGRWWYISIEEYMSAKDVDTLEIDERRIVRPQEQGWISVKERLPDTRDDVLCMTKLINKKPVHFVGIYTSGNQIEFYNHDDDTDYLDAGWYELEDQHNGDYDGHWFEREVTHWMPLPNQ